MATLKLPSYKQLKALFKKLNYAFFDNGDFNLNIIGIRTKDTAANTFNDWLLVAFKHAGQEFVLHFPATTDPGIYYRKNPINVDGTGWVVPDQYRGLWQLGRHQGRYPALVQRGLVSVYRDDNRNGKLDESKVEQGYFGINLHRALENAIATKVGKFSAGCQVLQDDKDLKLLLALCEKAQTIYGDNFTYTLLNEEQL